MNLIALPAFTDNYIWIFHDGHHALVVDPGTSAPVEHFLDAQQLTLAGILVTHHHSDHIGGLSALRARLQGPLYGPARENIPQPYIPLKDGDAFELLNCHFEVIEVPGHTAGHIAFFHAPANAAPLVFCGDTLFSAGCGRLFEGTAEQMHKSLSRLASLPSNTRVCCAHEYTLANLKFAHEVEPHNADVSVDLARCESLRAKGLATVPSSIAQELRINPFLRCNQTAVMEAARAHGACSERGPEILAVLREWKNTYQ